MKIKFYIAIILVTTFTIFLVAQVATNRFGVVNKSFDPDPLHAPTPLMFGGSAGPPPNTGGNRDNGGTWSNTDSGKGYSTDTDAYDFTVWQNIFNPAGL
jgi:hypothetical protein